MSAEGPEEEVGAVQEYPPFVESDEDRERWDLSLAVAHDLFEDLGPAATWGAARAIFSSDVPTAA